MKTTQIFIFTVLKIFLYSLQSFFVYLHVEERDKLNQPVIQYVILFSLNYVVLYTLDLILTIKIYDEIRQTSEDETNRVLNNAIDFATDNGTFELLTTTEMIVIERLHQSFTFEAFGMFEINNALLGTIFSSIITNMIVFIQFRQDEDEIAISSVSKTSEL